MTPLDILRAVTEAEIGREIIRLVPHWYEADCGPERYSVTVGPAHCPFLQPLQAHAQPGARSWRKFATRPEGTPPRPFHRSAQPVDVLLEISGHRMAANALQRHGLAAADQVSGDRRPADLRKPAGPLNLIVAERDGRGRHLRLAIAAVLRPACLVAIFLPCRGRRSSPDALWRSGMVAGGNEPPLQVPPRVPPSDPQHHGRFGPLRPPDGAGRPDHHEQGRLVGHAAEAEVEDLRRANVQEQPFLLPGQSLCGGEPLRGRLRPEFPPPGRAAGLRPRAPRLGPHPQPGEHPRRRTRGSNGDGLLPTGLRARP